MRVVVSLLIIVCLVNNANAQSNKIWTLQGCIDYAIEQNISIKQSLIDKESAEQDVIAAKYNFVQIGRAHV